MVPRFQRAVPALGMDSYRTLDAWKLAHEICIRTLRATENAPSRSWAIIDQLRRAVVSIEANVVEGYALETSGYIVKHVRIAFGSAAEAECLIRDAEELGYLPLGLAAELLPLVQRCLEILRGLLRRYGS